MEADDVTGEIVENALALVEKAKLDGAVAWAKNNPRDSFKEIRERCWETMVDDPEILENSYYETPGRKKKGSNEVAEPFIGPNIRLAEIWAGEVGNTALGIGFAEVNRGDQRVNVRAFAHDLEKNTRIEEEYSTRILWGGADGEKNALDRARSFAFRNCVNRMFGVHLRLLAKKARLALENTSDIEGAWGRTVKAFATWDVTEDSLFEWLGRVHGKSQDADVTGEHIAKLRGCYQAILNAFTTVDAQFWPDKTKENFEGTVDMDKLKKGTPPPDRDDSVPKAPKDEEPETDSPEKPSDILADAVAEADEKSKKTKKEKANAGK